jgi:hypothetical protein
MLGAALIVTYAECHMYAPYAECHIYVPYAECHYANCCYAVCHGIKLIVGNHM